MRLSGSLFFSAALLAAVLIPAAGTASELHSWCSTGPALSTTAGDTTTNEIISNVCGRFNDCCSTRWGLKCVQAASSYQYAATGSDNCGRYQWAQGPIGNTHQYYPRDFNLFARYDVSGFSDAQGPVAATSITASNFRINYSRQEPIALLADSSITLNTGGTVYGTVDYGGCNCTGTYFHDTPQVTYVDGTRPTQAVSNLINFNNAWRGLNHMSGQLDTAYDKISVKPNNKTIQFAGTDLELNVFSVYYSDLNGITSFIFDVPQGSAVIINVEGPLGGFSATIENAGFSGRNGAALPTSPSQILWNFFSATKLLVQSASPPGSILAPSADATFNWGVITGTVVAQSVVMNSELDWVPYQVPSSVGCLPLDPFWSCSNDTANDDGGNAAALKAEAGFLDIPAEPYIAQNQQRTSPEHRIWYAFQPALTYPASKPLIVFFNGGPGSNTSALQFSFNTATYTLDPDNSTGLAVAINPHPWTQLGNLLYIDAPATGFSYPLQGSSGFCDVGIDIDRDAGIFLSVITRFLLRHTALLGNRVILVGESYGGVRATLMMNYLYNYSSLPQSGLNGPAYQDAQVYDDLINYFQHAFPNISNPKSTQAADIATKFGHQVLVEPNIEGFYQVAATQPQLMSQGGCVGTMPTCPVNVQACTGLTGHTNCCQAPSFPSCDSYATVYDNSIPPKLTQIGPYCDSYSCDKQPNWEKSQEGIAATNLNTVVNLSWALGVDSTSIQWMHASSRQNACGRNSPNSGMAAYFTTPSGGNMANTFSDGGYVLNAYDNYFVIDNSIVEDGYGCNFAQNSQGQWGCTGTVSRKWGDSPFGGCYAVTGNALGSSFLTSLQNGVHTFITVAEWDHVIWSPSIALGFTNSYQVNSVSGPITCDSPFANIVTGSTAYNANYLTTLSLPGAMQTYYTSSYTTPEVTVDMPTAYASGHTVAMHASSAEALLGDVMQFYALSSQ